MNVIIYSTGDDKYTYHRYFSVRWLLQQNRLRVF